MVPELSIFIPKEKKKAEPNKARRPLSILKQHNQQEIAAPSESEPTIRRSRSGRALGTAEYQETLEKQKMEMEKLHRMMDNSLGLETDETDRENHESNANSSQLSEEAVQIIRQQNVMINDLLGQVKKLLSKQDEMYLKYGKRWVKIRRISMPLTML